MGTPVWLLGLIAIPALIVINGLFVAAEFALVSVRKTRVEEMIAQDVRGARAVELALDRLDRSIAATQLGITLSSIALGWVGEPSLAHLVEPLFVAIPESLNFLARHSVASGLAFIAITFIHVVFGELIPKALAIQTADRTALWTSQPLLIFTTITRPLTGLMNFVSNRILRVLGMARMGIAESAHSVEELALLIEDTEEAGILEPDQAEFVQNVFQLSSKQVKDCMVTRDKMACLELSTPPDKVLEAVRSGAHTRIPVYEGTLDHIAGIVNTKDLFYLFSLQGVVILEDAMYPPLFLKPDENVATALRLFRQAKRPMALVRDENDHILGLITLEDVLEEIVGDIEDEHDRPTPKVRRRGKRPPVNALPALASLPKGASAPPRSDPPSGRSNVEKGKACGESLSGQK